MAEVFIYTMPKKADPWKSEMVLNRYGPSIDW